jgi:hypothetical protein
MAKKKVAKVENVETPVVEVIETVVETPVVAEIPATKQKGRPVVPNSVRQAKLAARAARAAQGLSIGRGRPVSSTSARQQKIADRLAKIAAGIEIKRGAPKKVIIEAVVEAPAEMVGEATLV